MITLTPEFPTTITLNESVSFFIDAQGASSTNPDVDGFAYEWAINGQTVTDWDTNIAVFNNPIPGPFDPNDQTSGKYDGILTLIVVGLSGANPIQPLEAETFTANVNTIPASIPETLYNGRTLSEHLRYRLLGHI